MNNNVLTEEEYIDEDYKEIAGGENETDLVTKLNSPINLILISLIIIVIMAIILVAIFM